jgi:hypothetical protein
MDLNGMVALGVGIVHFNEKGHCVGMEYCIGKEHCIGMEHWIGTVLDWRFWSTEGME